MNIFVYKMPEIMFVASYIYDATDVYIYIYIYMYVCIFMYFSFSYYSRCKPIDECNHL